MKLAENFRLSLLLYKAFPWFVQNDGKDNFYQWMEDMDNNPY